MKDIIVEEDYKGLKLSKGVQVLMIRSSTYV